MSAQPQCRLPDDEPVSVITARPPEYPVLDARRAWLLAMVHALRASIPMSDTQRRQAAAQATLAYAQFDDPGMDGNDAPSVPDARFDPVEICVVAQGGSEPPPPVLSGVRLPFHHDLDLAHASVTAVNDCRLGAAVAHREALEVILHQAQPLLLRRGQRRAAAALAQTMRSATRLLLRHLTSDEFSLWHPRLPLFGDGQSLRAIESLASTGACQRALAMHLATAALEADLDAGAVGCAHLCRELAAAQIAVAAHESILRDQHGLDAPFRLISDIRASLPLRVAGPTAGDVP